jgi:hypothetical protein
MVLPSISVRRDIVFYAGAKLVFAQRINIGRSSEQAEGREKYPACGNRGTSENKLRS